MIIYEEHYNKVNIILIIDNQCGLQALFDYVIYLCIQLNEVLLYSGTSTMSTYLLNVFKHPITSWLSTISHFNINNIDEIKTIDQCR
ncbi:unnamed protein product [Adineta steineri]|uniref:Uncharacterized protein n=1 Tax=Adineta steineri TaxID=433720 RepID=A0A819BSW5_9BILA|nr:unnamed protein product [Adineta steineri]CAF3806330.1 unnamed protein product [Adineta steineri]